MVKKWKKAVGVIGLMVLGFSPLNGGELAQCLLQNTPLQKQEVLVKWVVALYAQDSKFRGLISVNRHQFQQVEREAVQFLRELPKKCARQFGETMLKEGLPGIQREFNLYGQTIGHRQTSRQVTNKVQQIVSRLLIPSQK